MHVGSAPEAVKLNSADGLPIDGTNPLPTTGGGGGGGSALADVLLTDNTGALFVSRDNGTTVTYFNLNTNAVYTPSGTIKPATLTDAQLRATAVPVSGTFFQTTQPVSIATMPTTPVTGTFWQATQPVSGPLTNAEYTAVAATKITSVPDNQLAGNPVRVIGQDIWNCSFSSVGASVLAPQLATPIVGTGVGYSQATGNLAITTGITVNAEFLTRSTVAWRSSMRHRAAIVASQRIANQNLAFILGDLVVEGAACTINSATSITVTKVAHGYTAQSVGQFMFVGGIVGAAGVPGRYAIASIPSVDTITFTVAGWPASGTCTLTLFGHSHVKTLLTGVTATNANWTTQRNGWADADTVATINTTASPGTVLQVELDGRQCYLSDTLRATTTTPTVTTRASRVENIPDDNLDLYLWVWSYNGTVAPATTTTWTISFLAVERFANTPVYIQGYRAQGTANSQSTIINGGVLPTVTTVGTVTTVATVTNGNTGFPGIIADVASAALTTTTTTAAITPTYGSAYSISIPVTLVSGTTPTLDVSIEESDDSGTNWFKVYDFPRITAAGIYRSPVVSLTGNRVRYVQTVTGTTPSFTRAINRLQSSAPAVPTRQLIDRTVVLTTLNSVTPSLDTRDCGNRNQLVINVGAVTTTAPALQLEGSDDNGATWYAIGTPLTAVASSSVQVTVTGVNAALTRARVSTAGVGVTAGYVMIKAHD